MDKGREKEREKKMYVGIVFNYAAKLKLLLTTLLVLCALATLLQFLRTRFTFSTFDLHLCISTQLSSPSPSSLPSSFSSCSSIFVGPSPLAFPLSPSLSSVQKNEVLDNGIIRRAFNPYGAAAYNFIMMGAYRGGLDTFAIVGLVWGGREGRTK